MKKNLTMMWMGVGILVLAISGNFVFASQDASLFNFYSPVKYSAENAYLFKIHNLQNGTTTNMDSTGIVDYTIQTGAGVPTFNGGIEVFKGSNGNNWMYSTLNWGGWDPADDGTSVIRLYEDTGSGFVYKKQVYYEGKYPDSGPGDRMLMGLALANIDGDEYQDMIVAVKYANESQYFNWFEDDGTGNFAPAANAGLGGTLVGSKWLAHGIETGNWTGVTTYNGKPVVTELLITAEYDPGTFNDSTYLMHRYVVDNGDGTYSIEYHSNIVINKSSPGPFWTGVAVLGPADDAEHPSAEGWLDIVLATNYIDENSYYSRAYYNPNYTGQENANSSSHWDWQTGLLVDTNSGRDFNDVDAMFVPEPVTMGLLLLGLPMIVRRRK